MVTGLMTFLRKSFRKDQPEIIEKVDKEIIQAADEENKEQPYKERSEK